MTKLAERGSEGFSPFPGGPFFGLLRRLHLSGEGLECVHRRSFALALISWLPLLILSAWEGQALGTEVGIPFMLDAEPHVRFLVAMPLLIFAEYFVHQRIRSLVMQFIDRKLIPQEALAQFHEAVVSSLRWRGSITAEVIMAAIIALLFPIFWRQSLAQYVTAWHTVAIPGSAELSLAGMWYAFFAVPLFQFLLLRWYFRLFVWARFLWKISRIPLNLVASHPDRVGGLGFLGAISGAFAPLALAHGAMLAAVLANHILHTGAALPDYLFQIGLVIAIVLCAVFGPMLVFMPQLEAMRWKGLAAYGALAARYVQDFDDKWLKKDSHGSEKLLGSEDIGALADLNQCIEVVQGARLLPFTIHGPVTLAVFTVLPVLPLLLTVMSLRELLKGLAGLLL